jgi:hypothetical protein
MDRMSTFIANVYVALIEAKMGSTVGYGAALLPGSFLLSHFSFPDTQDVKRAEGNVEMWKYGNVEIGPFRAGFPAIGRKQVLKRSQKLNLDYCTF